jgi:hypothetical protein
LTSEQKKNESLLLDLEIDLVAEGVLRLDLNIVFNPLPIRRGVFTKEDFYIGSSGAQIFVDTDGGRVEEYTPAVELSVKYSNSTKQKRTTTLCIKPSAKLTAQGAELDVTPGSITLQANDERTFTASFAGAERTLAPVYLNDSIRWEIALPRGDKVVRDFLIGNLYLFARAKWAARLPSGSIELRPADVRFFDSKRQVLSKLKSILMMFVLSKEGVRPRHKDGFKISFAEQPS